jgi:hypothetical protein
LCTVNFYNAGAKTIGNRFSEPGTNVVISKVFSAENWQKLVFLTVSLLKIDNNIGFQEKTPNLTIK